jgi:hypothetical protein
MQRPHFDH